MNFFLRYLFLTVETFKNQIFKITSQPKLQNVWKIFFPTFKTGIFNKINNISAIQVTIQGYLNSSSKKSIIYSIVTMKFPYVTYFLVLK